VARETALLQAVHRRPGLSRAEAATLLGLSTGAAAELMAKLAAAHLLSERSLAPTGSRGRPSRQLVPHPSGPLVLAAEITQTTWRMQVVQLGGDLLAQKQGEHDGGPGEVLAVMAGAGSALRRRFPGRVRGLGLSVPGTVLNAQTLDSVGLGWQDVDLRSIWPRGALVLADNDASLAALAEARRGGAIGAQLALYLRVEVGLGGALIERGRLLSGSRGVAGEFGHMPFGDPRVICPCGARGCWGTAVDGGALARSLGEPVPADPIGYAHAIISGDRADGAREQRAVRAIATALGRGIAGLVNGLDPDLVIIGGLAQLVERAQPAALQTALRAGLMGFRASTPPAVTAAELGEAGSLIGATWPAPVEADTLTPSKPSSTSVAGRSRLSPV
jgi:predicted NBD/HSP70 family sugar kinase